jgi:DNA-binding transcriptional MerR regulator
MAGPTYTIKQIAERSGMSEDTIRYYEKIALLPRANRRDNGHRVYGEEDIQSLKLISCLKKTGMPLEEMRPFLAVSADADPGDYPELAGKLRRHRDNIVSQIASLQQVVDFIDRKLEEGAARRDCSDGRPEGAKEKRKASPAEMQYFSGHRN